MIKSLLAGLLSAWLAIAPVSALANGALLIVPAGGGQLAPLPTGSAPVFNQIVANSGNTGVPSATFGSTPTTNDWLVAVVTESVVTATPGTGWTYVQNVPACNNAPYKHILYHRVVGGDGTTYTPLADSQTGVWAVSIVDLTSNNSTWAALLQQIVSACNFSMPTSVTVSGNGPPNTGVFAVGFASVPTSGSLSANPTMTGVTTGLQASHINGAGAALGTVAAQTTLTGTDPIAVSATPSASGTNINEMTGILVFLNPG